MARSPTLVARRCAFCGKTFWASRSDAKFHTPHCRAAFYRWRKRLPYYSDRVERIVNEMASYLAYDDAKPLAARLLTDAENLITQKLREANIQRVK
jgi:hypothetical protein